MALSEKSFRKLDALPPRPDKNIFRELFGEIGRVSSFDDSKKDNWAELKIVLEHMVRSQEDALNDIWDFLDILKNRFGPGEDDDDDDLVLRFVETGRSTRTRERVIATDDGEYEVTVSDTVTDQIKLKGKSGQMTLIFKEQL